MKASPKAVLEKHPHVPHMLVDYRQLTTEPRQTIHELYKNLEMNVSEQYDQYLIEHEQKEKSHKTHFRYSIEEYDGLSVEKIEQQLDGFFKLYNWDRPSENPDIIGGNAN